MALLLLFFKVSVMSTTYTSKPNRNLLSSVQQNKHVTAVVTIQDNYYAHTPQVTVFIETTWYSI